MKEEHSAGGVIVKKIHDVWHVLLLNDMHGNWTFPKGIIDPGETAKDAAVREIHEEVGITDLKLHIPLHQVSYQFVRNGDTIHKTVDYFLFESTIDENLTPQTEEGITDVQWFEFEKGKEMIGYPKTNSVVLIKAYDYTLTR